jgi:hypothetical protein
MVGADLAPYITKREKEGLKTVLMRKNLGFVG